MSTNRTGSCGVYETIIDPVKNERRDPDRWKDLTDVDFNIHPVKGQPCAGTRQQAHMLRPPLAPPLVACDAGGEDHEANGRNPSALPYALKTASWSSRL